MPKEQQYKNFKCPLCLVQPYTLRHIVNCNPATWPPAPLSRLQRRYRREWDKGEWHICQALLRLGHTHQLKINVDATLELSQSQGLPTDLKWQAVQEQVLRKAHRLQKVVNLQATNLLLATKLPLSSHADH